MKVFSLDKEGNGKKQEAKEYKVKKEDGTLGDAEILLQEIIFKSPNMFPASEISGGNTSIWIPLAMEVRLKGHQGRLDILGTDSVGNIYIFECKLHTNAETKTIHSQIGNYAAAFYKQKENDELEEDIVIIESIKKTHNTDVFFYLAFYNSESLEVSIQLYNPKDVISGFQFSITGAEAQKVAVTILVFLVQLAKAAGR